MQIDRKRVYKTVLGIAGLVAFVMLIPKAMDNNRRYQEQQALQLEERTLHHSTPATTAEQKAILQTILPRIELFTPPPKNGEEDRPVYPSELNKIVFFESTPSCIYGFAKLKAEIGNFNGDFDNSKCRHGLVSFFNSVSGNDAFNGLGLDLLKANRNSWLNPNPMLVGVVHLSENQCKKMAASQTCEITCFKKIPKELNQAGACVNVSRAVISTDKNHALVTLEYTTYSFGYMNAILLKKVDGRWIIETTKGVYIT